MRHLSPYPREIFGGNLYFGGGPDPVAPPPPPPVPAAPAPDTAAGKEKASQMAKRRVGGTDALSGNVLGSLREKGRAATLGGSAPVYTGEQ